MEANKAYKEVHRIAKRRRKNVKLCEKKILLSSTTTQQPPILTQSETVWVVVLGYAFVRLYKGR